MVETIYYWRHGYSPEPPGHAAQYFIEYHSSAGNKKTFYFGEDYNAYYNELISHRKGDPWPWAEGYITGNIDFTNTTFFPGPFDSGQEYVSVVDLYVKNTGTIAGKIWIKLYENPGEANETVVAGPMYTTPDVQPGESRQCLFYVTIPTTPGTWPLGLKVWGEDQTEPGWGDPDKTHQWSVQIGIGLGVIGKLLADSVYNSGPFEPGQTYVTIANAHFKNIGDQAGKIYFKIYENPGGAQNPIHSSYTTPPMNPGESRYQPFIVETIPSTPGNWPLGLKLWGESESEPAWGDPDKTHQWTVIISSLECEDYTTKTQCEAYGCHWYNGACHSYSPSCNQLNNQSDCERWGCYWYDGACHSSPPIECSQYTNQSSCETAGCYWYNGACHSSPPVECSQYTNQSSCETAGCYWYDEACHSEPPPCEYYTTQYACEQMGCYWYDGACHSPAPPIEDYLPWILIGGGIAIMVAAVAIPKLKKKL